MVIPLMLMAAVPVRPGEESGKLTLPALFSDHMVLQQKALVTVWGTAGVDQTVVVNGSWGEGVSCQADGEGNWRGQVKTPAYGGPYQLTVSCGGESKTFSDVLIGEVWLASGQSNMEMPLMGWPPSDPIENSDEVIAAADNDAIRFFTVARAARPIPQNNCSGIWQVSKPQTARMFSATAYFFANKLNKTLGMPVGIIHSSWGGTPAEAWISREFIASDNDFETVLADIEANLPEIKALEAWIADKPRISIAGKQGDEFWGELDFRDQQCAQPGFADSQWPEMDLPQTWENGGLKDFDGVVWFRKTIEIPESWAGKDLQLDLGPVDDMDATYLNGTLVGSIQKLGMWQQHRSYRIPAGIVKPGKNVLAVRVIDNQGGGGLFGAAEDFLLKVAGAEGQQLSLAGPWKYLPVAEYQSQVFYLFDVNSREFLSRPKVSVPLSPNTPSFLYNGMIHPLVPYTLKGAIWYQGESNVGRAAQYQRIFPLLIKNWRADWKQGNFPFYFVQIAPWNYGDGPSQLLREAQFKTLALPNTGMAVTLDIGNVNNIHPAQKKEVGERLALWALDKDYGRDMVYSGPLYKSMTVKNGKIYLSFEHVAGGLSSPENELSYFEIAGADEVFVKARAVIEGDKVVVWHDQIKEPVAVRYSWGNTTQASLFNKSGLPASSFRTDNW